MKENTEVDIKHELIGARSKFPSNKHMMTALTEEVGELAQALIDCERGDATPAQVYAEAIQVACMAVRIAEEGSEEFNYKYLTKHSIGFRPTGRIKTC